MSTSFTDFMHHLKTFDSRLRSTDHQDSRSIEVMRNLVKEEFLIDGFTGLQNRRAFEDCETHRAVFLEIDIRSLWTINKKYGRDVGDWVMGRVVDHIWLRWKNAYRLFADKFIVEFDDECEAKQFAMSLCADLKRIRLYRQVDGGKVTIIDGIQIWYGIGRDVTSADRAMTRMKSARKK